METAVKATEVPPVRSKTSAARDVLTLAGGTTSAQLITILSAPLITRLFGPSELGTYALFVAVTSLIAIVSCLRYEYSIVLPEQDREGVHALGASLSCVALTASTVLIAALIAQFPLHRWFSHFEVGQFIWLLPVYAATYGTFTSLRMWNVRNRRFRRLTRVEVLNSVCIVTIQIVVGLLGFRSGRSLVLAAMSGTLLSTLVLGIESWRQWSALFREHISWEGAKRSLKRYVRFPKFGVGHVLNQVSWQLPAFMLSAFFGPAVVGQYAIGQRLMRVPMSLIGMNVGSVFFQRAAEARHDGTLATLVETAFRYLVKLTLLPCLVLAFIGRDLFVLVFGERWAEAGVFTEILSVWTCFWFISSPMSNLYDVLEQQGKAFRINTVILATRFLSLGAGAMLGGPRTALVLFGVSGVLVYGYMSLSILKMSGVPTLRMLRVLWNAFAMFIPAGLVLGFLKWRGVHPLMMLSAGGLVILLHCIRIVQADPLARQFIKKTVSEFRSAQTAAAA